MTGLQRTPGTLSSVLCVINHPAIDQEWLLFHPLLIYRATMDQAWFLLLTGFIFLTVRPWAKRGLCPYVLGFIIFLTSQPLAKRSS